MKTEKLYGILATFLFLFGMAACSDNKDGDLKPTSSTRELELEADGQTTSDKTGATAIDIKLNAGTKPIHVEVKSNTLWRVEISGNAGWCEVDVVRGQGDGSFTISVLDNLNMHEPRNCSVYVYQVDRNDEEYTDGNRATINIKQEGSEVRITPSSLDIFPAKDAPSKDFEVIANTSWTLSVGYETESSVKFLIIEPGNGMTVSEGANGEQIYSGEGNASFKVSLQNNGTALVRRATIDLKSGSGDYSIEISQQKADYTFDVSPNGTRYVKAEGDPLDFTVHSTADGWSVSADGYSWITCPENDFGPNENRVSIKITIAPNSNGRERQGTITFKSQNRGYEDVIVTVVQAGYRMAFSGSVEKGSPDFVAKGGSLTYSLDSSFDWDVTTPPWVEASSSTGEASVERQTLSLTAVANSTGRFRNDTVRITPRTTKVAEGVELNPKDLGFHEIKIAVSQKGYDLSFRMSPESFEVVPVEGRNYSVTVDSRFDWIITASDWIVPTISEGAASTTEQRVDIRVERNPYNGTRTGSITLTPKPTLFSGDIKLDPTELGITPKRLSVTQFGGQKPAVSVPWVSYTPQQTNIELSLNYYSPFIQVSSAGFEWKLAGSDSWNDRPVSINDHNSGTVTVTLTDLQPVTSYQARGYVVAGNDTVRGGVTEPFTTAGRYPSGGDNPTPSR